MLFESKLTLSRMVKFLAWFQKYLCCLFLLFFSILHCLKALSQQPFPAKCHIYTGLLFLPLASPLTHQSGKSSHVTTSYLPHNLDFSNCKENSLLSMHENTQYAVITFWKWGLRVFSVKSNLHFSATNASFLLRRIICTTDLYLKIEGQIYAKMISGDHCRNTKK